MGLPPRVSTLDGIAHRPDVCFALIDALTLLVLAV